MICRLLEHLGAGEHCAADFIVCSAFVLLVYFIVIIHMKIYLLQVTILSVSRIDLTAHPVPQSCQINKRLLYTVFRQYWINKHSSEI